MTVTPVKDLRQIFGNARDQGERPTCCAFACSDFNAACRQSWVELSCEYAFFYGARRQGTGPNSGVYLRHMLDALENDGQPVDAAWPYLKSVPSDLSQWKPPADVGELYHAKGKRFNGSVLDIRNAIDQGRPAVIILSISDAFYAGPNSDGVIDAAEPIDAIRVHALVAVGRGSRSHEGFTLVRNSWGEGWGLSGYCWLSDLYLAPRIIEIAVPVED